MRLHIDTSATRYTATGAPTPVLDRETRTQRVDDQGRLLFTVSPRHLARRTRDPRRQVRRRDQGPRGDDAGQGHEARGVAVVDWRPQRDLVPCGAGAAARQGGGLMGRLILLALLASLVTCCVLWLLVHATLLVIGLLEAALALGAFAVLRVSSQLGSGGPLLVGGIIAMALWQTPDLRVKVRSRLDQARLRRKMTAAFRRCCIVGYFGDAPKITQIGRVP